MPDQTSNSDLVDSKRIIICCDGTWQSAVSGEKNSPSNVTRIARSLKRAAKDKDGKVWQQVVWYDSGVGTTSGWLGRKLEGAVGQGLEGNVIEAYNFCVLNYAPGDQILCFGFSRGAYTARAIAGLISDIGICKPSGLHNFFEIWDLYKKSKPGQRFYGSDAFFDYRDGIPADPKDQLEGVTSTDDARFVWQSPPHGDWASHGTESREIEVVGVFDTVGSLGMPSVFGYEAKILFGPDKLGFHNVRLSRNVKRAYHALAIDEHRKAFTPTLWHREKAAVYQPGQVTEQETKVKSLESAWWKYRIDGSKTLEDKEKKKIELYEARRELIVRTESQKPRSQLRQVWFPGVHINIGGGSTDSLEDKGDLEEMANITFAWMLDQIRDYVAIDYDIVVKEAQDLADHIAKLNQRAKANQAKIDAEKNAAKKATWGQWAYKGFSSAANTVMHPLTKAEVLDTTLREQGWGTGTIIDSYSAMYAPNGSQPRRPGQYDTAKMDEDLDDGTFEFIHPSVGYRIKSTHDDTTTDNNYLPCNDLKESDVKRYEVAAKIPTSKIGFEYEIAGVKLPEWKIASAAPDAGATEIPYERLAVLGATAQEYVHGLDRKYAGNEANIPRQTMGVPPRK